MRESHGALDSACVSIPWKRVSQSKDQDSIRLHSPLFKFIASVLIRSWCETAAVGWRIRRLKTPEGCVKNPDIPRHHQAWESKPFPSKSSQRSSVFQRGNTVLWICSIIESMMSGFIFQTHLSHISTAISIPKGSQSTLKDRGLGALKLHLSYKGYLGLHFMNSIE